jgi:hypothetical protein
MPELILTKEQAEMLSNAHGPVAVKDAKGNVLGRFEPKLTPAQVVELKRIAASPGPWFTGEQVRSQLSALQAEWDRTGGFDEASMSTLLEQLDKSDLGHTHPTGEKDC